MDELAACGYVANVQLLIGSEFGVPQQRKRLFFVAIRHDIYHRRGKPYLFPAGEKPSKVVADILEKDVTDFLECELEPVKNPRSDHTLPMQRGWVAGRNHSQRTRIYDVAGQGITMMANAGDLGGVTGLYEVAENCIRPLTKREGNRMNGLPESHINVSSEAETLKQMGNSVVVPVIAAVAGTFAEYLD